ncbi:MAG: hypothetical protein LBH14_06985 [Desulfobulbaceae bacterium]|jgi:hypothetical protein|nr:hypothetical protein [Desulfobulbaceae bacterium]
MTVGRENAPVGNSGNDSRGQWTQLIFPLVVSVIVGVGSSAIASHMTMARLDERVIHLELYVKNRAIQIETQRAHESDFERRISRLESTTEHTSKRLDEIGADIKTMLKQQR